MRLIRTNKKRSYLQQVARKVRTQSLCAVGNKDLVGNLLLLLCVRSLRATC